MSSLKMFTVNIDDIKGNDVYVSSGIANGRLNQELMNRANALGVTGALILIRYWYSWNVCDLYEVHFSGGDSAMVPCALYNSEVGEKQTYSMSEFKHVHTTQLFCRFCSTACVRELISGSSKQIITHPEPGALLRYSELADVGVTELLSWFEIFSRTKSRAIDRGDDCRFAVVSNPTQGEVRRLRIGTFSETYIISYDGMGIEVEKLEHSEVRRIWERSQDFPTPGYDIRTGEPVKSIRQAQDRGGMK